MDGAPSLGRIVFKHAVNEGWRRSQIAGDATTILIGNVPLKGTVIKLWGGTTTKDPSSATATCVRMYDVRTERAVCESGDTAIIA